MRDQAARIRTGTVRAAKPSATDDPRVRVDLAHLRSLERKASEFSFLPRQPARSALNGRHASRLRGRGLDFAEIRAYLPGDDIRSIDWKVTARTRTPQVRVFNEERDRPSLICVDQRMSMFFGSVLNMKSVTAAECAALMAFRILDQGDRVGGLVFADAAVAEIKPARSRRTLNRFLMALANANGQLRADAPQVAPLPLNRALHSVLSLAKNNHFIAVLSDFDETDDSTERLVAEIAKHNDLVVGIVSDPFARELPEELRLTVSDGELQAAIDTRHDSTRRRLSELARGRLADVLQWTGRYGIPVLPLTTAEDSVIQMRRIMGLHRRTA